MAAASLQALLRQPGNSLCADCNARNPKWASVNLGVFICESCAGIHRNLGTHVSQVRSVKLDTWKPEWVQKMASVGNVVAKAYYEQNVPDAERYAGSATQIGGDRLDPEDARRLEKWIRNKYEEKRYISSRTALPEAAGQVAELKPQAGASNSGMWDGRVLPGKTASATQSRRQPEVGIDGNWGSAACSGNTSPVAAPKNKTGAMAGDPWGMSALPRKAAPAAESPKRQPGVGAGEISAASWSAAAWPQAESSVAADPWASAAWPHEPSQNHDRQKDKPKKSHRRHVSMSSTVSGGWAIDAVRLKQYQDGFMWADTDRNGLISAAEARVVLETSGLPMAELSHIWQMSDIGQDGQLSPGEFVCAMHLTFRRWQGAPLPRELPQELAAMVEGMQQHRSRNTYW